MRQVRYILDGNDISYEDLIYLLFKTKDTTKIIALKDMDTYNNTVILETYDYAYEF